MAKCHLIQTGFIFFCLGLYYKVHIIDTCLSLKYFFLKKKLKLYHTHYNMFYLSQPSLSLSLTCTPIYTFSCLFPWQQHVSRIFSPHQDQHIWYILYVQTRTQPINYYIIKLLNYKIFRCTQLSFTLLHLYVFRFSNRCHQSKIII